MERLTVPKLAGAITAFAGVVVLFSPSFSGQISAAGLLAIFTAATMSVVGNVALKRGPRQNPIGANAVGCAIGAVISAGASFAMREPHPLPTSVATLGPLLYLTIAGSMGAFVAMSWLVNHWTLTRVSYISVLVPVIAMALGSLLHHEPITLTNLAGTALVLAGVLIGMRRPAAKR
jgi:drug/metabolite transporter (DMT)-like permease